MHDMNVGEFGEELLGDRHIPCVALFFMKMYE